MPGVDDMKSLAERGGPWLIPSNNWYSLDSVVFLCFEIQEKSKAVRIFKVFTIVLFRNF